MFCKCFVNGLAIRNIYISLEIVKLYWLCCSVNSIMGALFHRFDRLCFYLDSSWKDTRYIFDFVDKMATLELSFNFEIMNLKTLSIT